MVQESILLNFPKGLAGFPEFKSFSLFEPKGGYPLKFLQSTDQPEVSFVCMDVAAIKIDYEVPLGDEEAELLGLERQEDALVLAMVVVPEDPRGMTANLAGPLVINARTAEGLQVMLDANKYPLQYPVFGPKDEIVLSFPKGLVGFPDLKSFRLFEPAGGTPSSFYRRWTRRKSPSLASTLGPSRATMTSPSTRKTPPSSPSKSRRTRWFWRWL